MIINDYQSFGLANWQNMASYFCFKQPIFRWAFGRRVISELKTLHILFHYWWNNGHICQSVQSVAQLCPTLYDPMDCSTPGFLVHHQFLKPTQTHIHWVGDAIQPSHLSQHQGLFKWVSSSHQVAKVLEFLFQHQFFHKYSGLISFRMDWLDLLAVQGL